VVSDTLWPQADRPAIPYGLRGLLGFCVRLQTGDKDVHSGTTGGAARNPLGELCALINACYDARTGRVKIPGFYRDVRRASAAERRGLARRAFSRGRFRRAHGFSSVRFPDETRLREAIMNRAHLRGPWPSPAGTAGRVSRHRASPGRGQAFLPVGVRPEARACVSSDRGFRAAPLPRREVIHESSLSPTSSIRRVHTWKPPSRLCSRAFGKRPALTREGGSIGAVVTMDRVLRAPVVLLGLSLPEHGYHAINENFDWGQARGGMEMFCRYFSRLADLPRRS